MTIEIRPTLDSQEELQTWSVPLAERWRIESLPLVWCQRKVTAGCTFGRVSFDQNSLSDQVWLNLEQPLRLTVHVEKKPWGRELWYTGIEKRGICGVETPSKERLSLPAYLALFDSSSSDESQRQDSAPPLLKILDPHTEPTQGCLYIEVHKEKWETYVVSSIDLDVWSDGFGEILFGFSESKLREYEGDWEKSLAGLQLAIERYESFKSELESSKQRAEKANAATLKQERVLWNELRAWFGVRRVQVGDVIEVPPGIPHSLQNGVRVIEFQTPTYERLIIAFNQKVLTQNHLDTVEALQFAQRRTIDELLELRSSSPSSLEHKAGSWDCIVDFPGFRVQRSVILSGSVLSLPQNFRERTGLVIVVSGRVEVVSDRAQYPVSMNSEEACYLPASSSYVQLRCHGATPAVVLIV